MKLMRFIPLIMLALLSFAACAESLPENRFGPNNEFIQCQRYDECMIVSGGCGDEAINKRYLDQFKPAAACLASSLHDPRAVPTCTDGKCVVVIPEKGGDQ